MRWEEDEPILADPAILSESHVPPDIPGRQSQIRELTAALKPATRRHKPIHCWVHGEPGTGKTATAKWLLRKLDIEAGVKGIYINCWEYPTYFSVLDRIVRHLRVLGAERLTVSFKLERLRRHIEDDPLILVLDEIDQPTPGERYSILYNLGQMGKVGMVCICNSERAYYGLEDRVKSRLNALRVGFSRYSPKDLFRILHDRAMHALSHGSWTEDQLREISELAEGDARVAVQTLRNAAVLADKDARERIEDQHIRTGFNSARDLRKSYMLGKLTDHHQLLYQVISDSPGIRSGKLRTEYLDLCKASNIEPIATRTFSKYCNKLGRLGLVNIKRAPVQGKVREFEPAP